MSISVGPGRYEETVNVFYYRAVEIIGDCSNLAAVEIAAAGVGIVIQDQAIGIIRCLTITAAVDGAAGIEGRQWAIVDIKRIRFGGFPLGVQIMVQESSRLTRMPGPAREPVVLVGSGAVVFAKADDGSHLVLDCPVLLEGDGSQSYSHFVQCLELSVCKMSGFSWSGPNITGKQFYCDNSDFTQPSGTAPSGYTVGIPGTGHDNPDSRCKVR